MGKRKKLLAALAVILLLAALIYGASWETDAGEMFILDKNLSPSGSVVLVVARDGAGAAYELSCTAEQAAQVEALDTMDCRWALNRLTHRGKLLEILEIRN